MKKLPPSEVSPISQSCQVPEPGSNSGHLPPRLSWLPIAARQTVSIKIKSSLLPATQQTKQNKCRVWWLSNMSLLSSDCGISLHQSTWSIELPVDTVFSDERTFFLPSFLLFFFSLSEHCYVMTVAGNSECHRVTIPFCVIPKAVNRKSEGLCDLGVLHWRQYKEQTSYNRVVVNSV